MVKMNQRQHAIPYTSVIGHAVQKLLNGHIHTSHTTQISLPGPPQWSQNWNLWIWKLRSWVQTLPLDTANLLLIVSTKTIALNNLHATRTYARSIGCSRQSEKTIVGTVVAIAHYLHCVSWCRMLDLQTAHDIHYKLSLGVPEKVSRSLKHRNFATVSHRVWRFSPKCTVCNKKMPQN